MRFSAELLSLLGTLFNSKFTRPSCPHSGLSEVSENGMPVGRSFGHGANWHPSALASRIYDSCHNSKLKGRSQDGATALPDEGPPSGRQQRELARQTFTNLGLLLTPLG